ncbi:MAG TPA: elongation factor G [Blastocatellia bacterium]|nr:elongation factor G [Blastocatellia bacterium]HMX25370.1 elongation factor G [Blastocatellia bacterium]HNG29854.1 elongation factor G [Blastocatellia bacterium]
MKVYSTQEIRNLGIVGHGDAGKTSLVAAMLFATGATNRLGKVDDGTATTDYDEEEVARKISLNISTAYVEHKGTKINLVDSPGYASFIGHAKGALRVCETAMFVVDAVSGIGVQTEKAWEMADELSRSRPRFIVINKLDKERADFGAVYNALRETFGNSCIPLTMPIGAEKNFRGVVDVIHMKAYEFDANGKPKEVPIPEDGRGYITETHDRLIETIAGTDETLMEHFFETGTLTDEEFLNGLRREIINKNLTPVFAVSSANLIGIVPLLDAIVDYAPDPHDLGAVKAHAGVDPASDDVVRNVGDAEFPAAYVFRTVVENFGKITLLKIWSGVLKSDATLQNIGKGSAERLGPLHVMQGKALEKITEAHAGDIVAVTKLKDTSTGDTLADKSSPILFEPVKYPEAAIHFAVQPKSRADEDKLSGAIHKIEDEDPLLHYTRNADTKEFELGGSSQQHIEAVVAKLKNRYHVEVELHQPKVPYRETIRTRVEVQGRHKKQTGGRGQFGSCNCTFEPLPRGGGFEFVDKIFGGAIPQQWRPAVQKGITDAAVRGALAGYPLVDFKVELIDGQYHDVDSDDLSFQMAGRKAFKAMIEKARPVLLEPVMHVDVICPQENAGDIMGDLNSRRGRIQGMDAKGNNQIIKAQVPMSEMLTYPQTLNSITSARGSYHMEFSHYDEAPAHIAQKIVQQAVAEGRVRKEEED